MADLGMGTMAATIGATTVDIMGITMVDIMGATIGDTMVDIGDNCVKELTASI